MAIPVAAVLFILAIMLVKYKFVYKVTISGEEIGYVSNKYEFEKLIDEKIINKNEANVAFVDMDTMPEYSLILADNNMETNEQVIFSKLDEDAKVTYKMYSVAVNDENATLVNTVEEAEKVVEEIKEQYNERLDEIKIDVKEIFTQDANEVKNTVELASAIETAENQVEVAIVEQEKIKGATLDGVYFSVRPVNGNITSRYGQQEDIRDHAHSGMDICAPAGTDIVAAADGTVTFAGTMGGYGNLIIITHENEIQTYYGHCSKLYASVGDEVKAGDLIAAVGMTGFATGNHLHFEIRKNGSTLNPQLYLYK